MNHPRQTIREAIAAQLVDKTEADDRVFRTRETPWRRIELPAISVFSLEETAQRLSSDGDLDRHVTVAIYGAVSVTDDVDDALDALALEIETAMAADPTFGSKAEGSTLTATTIGPDTQQGRQLGAVCLTYDVQYVTE